MLAKLSAWLRFLSSLEGRDALNKALQYGGRLLSAYFIALENHSIASKMTHVSLHMERTRRALRVGMFLHFAHKIRAMKAPHKSFPRSTTAMASAAFSMFSVFDSLLFLVDIQLLPLNAIQEKKLRALISTFQAIGLALTLVSCGIEMVKTASKRQRAEHRLQQHIENAPPESAPLIKATGEQHSTMTETHHTDSSKKTLDSWHRKRSFLARKIAELDRQKRLQLWALLHNCASIIVALDSSRLLKGRLPYYNRDAITGAAGSVAAAIGCYRAWSVANGIL